MKYDGAESSTLEFKQELPKNDQITKTVIGFCNRHGGRLVIGVANDGTVAGIDADEADKLMEYIDKMIYESTSPPIIPLVYTRQLHGKTLLIIDVSSGMNKPYYLSSQGLMKGTYIRLGRSTLLANTDIIEELRWSSRGISYETTPVYNAVKNDLNMNRIANFLNSRKQNKKRKNKTITDEVLLSYDLITVEHDKIYPTVAGILSFCDDPQRYLSEAMILCNHFSGIKGRKSMASRDCIGNIFEQFEVAYDFIVSQLNYSFTIKGKKRIEMLELPEAAIREALLNAIVHRNYHIKAPTKVAIFENRIEIFSPGDFPGPLNTNNLRQGITFLRNQAICKLFREAGYIEKLGTGLIELFDSYEHYQLEVPTVIEGDNYIKYILPRGSSIKKQQTTTSEIDKEILSLFDSVSEITISDVINILHIPRSTAGRRLVGLVNKKLLIRSGKGKGVKYKYKQ